MTYAWIIDRDHLAETADESEAGTTGPRNAAESLLSQLAKGKGEHFRMRDDDGELYYSGRIVFGGTDSSDSEAGFGPLDDFGLPNAGATSIEYQRHGRWETL